MVKPVASMFDLPSRHSAKGMRFESHATRLGGAIGAKSLGAQYMVVPAGKSAFPRHCHHNNEEMFIILEGEGIYRFGDESYPVKTGDICAAPAGGVATAHQVTNTGKGDLRYLAISTRNDPDICEYPDSGKFMIESGIPAGGGIMGAEFTMTGRERPALDYWDGEEIGTE